MSIFGQSGAFRPSGSSLFSSPATSGIGLGASSTTAVVGHNPMKDFEVTQPPDDSIQALKFSSQQNFLVAGAWDGVVRLWEVKQDGSSEPKAQQTMGGPVLEVDWSDDGSKVFIASADKKGSMWDLGSNTIAQVAEHGAPIKVCKWIKGTSYQCLMTGGWDKELRFWDLKSQSPIRSITVPERVYCADVVYPMAVLCTAARNVIVYQLDGEPKQYKTIDSPLKHQHRCISIFKDKNTGNPTGYALGSIEGRVAIQYVETVNPKDNFTFKCHRSPELVNNCQEIYAVNDIAFHPVNGTLATVGSDGRFSFWDKDARTKLKTSEKFELPVTRCCFNNSGEIFAYSISYDWSKGHESFNQNQKNYIFLRNCIEETKPRVSKK